MKSFRFYFREVALPVDKTVDDYTDEEKASFQNEYGKLLERNRVRLFWIFVAFVVDALVVWFCIAWLDLPSFDVVFSDAIVLCGICGIAAVLLTRPVCPACKNLVFGPIGMYCPLCGSHSLRSVLWGAVKECDECGNRFSPSRRDYIALVCSHCGIALRESGNISRGPNGEVRGSDTHSP